MLSWNMITGEKIATLCFVLAILHTFLVKRFQHLARKFAEGSIGENLFHLLGEVEIVFGLWAGIFLLYVTVSAGSNQAIQYLQTRNFNEPVFVFVIMTVCSSKPVLYFAERLIGLISYLLPMNKSISFYISTLVVGPLLGSLITEPAAMTVTALVLLEFFYKKNISQRLKYATIGLLFVNVSIGGVLTPFAAPPVLMVAQKWNWDFVHMLTNFGWKGIVAIVTSTAIVAFKFKNEIAKVPFSNDKLLKKNSLPIWVVLIHLVFLFLIVATSHYMTVFVGLFMFFIGLVIVTKEFQSEMKIKEGLLVGFFLSGLVVLGGQQAWWLSPLITSLGSIQLYLGSIFLTAFTDNAALTYLGSQVPNISEFSKYALVAGSVVGGGLTVIANAPNPAGYGILNPAFGEEGISPLNLFLNAILPTFIAGLCFWVL